MNRYLRRALLALLLLSATPTSLAGAEAPELESKKAIRAGRHVPEGLVIQEIPIDFNNPIVPVPFLAKPKGPLFAATGDFGPGSDSWGLMLLDNKTGEYAVECGPGFTGQYSNGITATKVKQLTIMVFYCGGTYDFSQQPDVVLGVVTKKKVSTEPIDQNDNPKRPDSR
jgi:hypothetical protein